MSTGAPVFVSAAVFASAGASVSAADYSSDYFDFFFFFFFGASSSSSSLSFLSFFDLVDLLDESQPEMGTAMPNASANIDNLIRVLFTIPPQPPGQDDREQPRDLSGLDRRVQKTALGGPGNRQMQKRRRRA